MVLEGGVVRMVTRGRLRAAVLLALAGLAVSAISCAAPGVAAAARIGLLGPTVCPAPRSFGSLPLFAHVKGADDVMVDSNGNVWVSSPARREVTELSPAGTVVHVFADRQHPEGMVQLSSSMMALANQRSDQVVVFDTTTGQSTPWVQLTPNGLGVDGIGMEPGMLLLPDSGQGNLDTVPLPPSNGGPETVATGLGRPVDATPVGDGTVLVSVENPPGLDRVDPTTGTVTPAADFTSTDDVVVSNGIAYVADNGGGTMSAVSLSSGMATTLVTGVKAAQGLAMRADGTFLVTDEKSGDIRVAMGC
jgi:streptogramin lyase